MAEGEGEGREHGGPSEGVSDCNRTIRVVALTNLQLAILIQQLSVPVRIDALVQLRFKLFATTPIVDLSDDHRELL
jgi:hypothetical protein